MTTCIKCGTLARGVTGFFNDRGDWVCTGSSMGRRDTVSPDRRTIVPKFNMRRLRWVDGDYDEQGAYWGYVPGTAIYWAQADVEGIDDIQEKFVRATSREDAKAQIREVFSLAKFYR